MKKYRNLAVKSTACILSAVMLFGSGFSAAAAGSDIPKDENEENGEEKNEPKEA